MVSINNVLNSYCEYDIPEINKRIEYEDRDNGLFFSTEKYSKEKLEKMCKQINEIECLNAMITELGQLIVYKNRGGK